MDLDPTGRQRQRDTTRPDAQLERPSVAYELRQHVNHRLYVLAVSEAADVFVVDLGDPVAVCRWFVFAHG